LNQIMAKSISNGVKRVYLDYAASTPIHPKVSKAMADFDAKYFGNPNSLHREGQEARAKIDLARADIAKFISAQPQEIIFTSGATESNNLAIQGVVSFAINEFSFKPHIITTKIEHPSVYKIIKTLEERGVVSATYISPDKSGIINPEEVIAAIRHETVLISVIFVSNEIGTIVPVRAIGKLLAEINDKQKHKIIFHTDAAQAIKYENCNVEKINCDLLTFSGHKIYGPKGIGVLYVKTGTKINSLFYGGQQEYKLRPGTQNTPGIIGFAKAIELMGSLDKRLDSAKKITTLRDQLISGLTKIPNIVLNGPGGKEGTSDLVSITIYGIDQESLLASLDLAGISVSTGSACISGAVEPSHVIVALGRINNRRAASVRFTLGAKTTAEEIKYTINTFTTIVRRLDR